MKHPHHDVIVAWAKDTSVPIQCRVDSASKWSDLQEHAGNVAPCWHPHWQYRIKPEPVFHYINCSYVNQFMTLGAYKALPTCKKEHATHELTYEDGKFVSLKEINK